MWPVNPPNEKPDKLVRQDNAVYLTRWPGYRGGDLQPAGAGGSTNTIVYMYMYMYSGSRATLDTLS